MSRPVRSRSAARIGWSKARRSTPSASSAAWMVSTMNGRSGMTVSTTETDASQPSVT